MTLSFTFHSGPLDILFIDEVSAVTIDSVYDYDRNRFLTDEEIEAIPEWIVDGGVQAAVRYFEDYYIAKYEDPEDYYENVEGN